MDSPLLNKLVNVWLKLYESKKLYTANPCDVDAHAALKPFGRALQWFGSHCPCCAGTRVLAAVALTALWPIPVAAFAAAIYTGLVIKEIAFPSED